MCGGVKVHNIKVRPGESLKYRTVSGERTGAWGLGAGRGAYNARVENLDTTWKKEKGNRGVLEVDSISESGVEFRSVDRKKVPLAVVYDDWGDFAMITQAAYGTVAAVHHRMPVPLLNPDGWLEGEDPVTMDVFEPNGVF